MFRIILTFCSFVSFLSITPTHSQFKCREYNVYKKKCDFFNFSAANCFKWDTSNCPPPRTRENTYCPVYACWKVRKYLLKQLKHTHNTFCDYFSTTYIDSKGNVGLSGNYAHTSFKFYNAVAKFYIQGGNNIGTEEVQWGKQPFQRYGVLLRAGAART